MLPEAGVAISTLGQFRVWLTSAPAGDTVAYYVGFLTQDRGPYPEMRRTEALDIAWEAWMAHEAGTVDLVQIKKGTGKYVYLAVKRKRRRRI